MLFDITLFFCSETKPLLKFMDYIDYPKVTLGFLAQVLDSNKVKEVTQCNIIRADNEYDKN